MCSAFHGAARLAFTWILALLLTLAPACSGWCQSLLCDAARSSASASPCHESVSTANPHRATLNSKQVCGLRELPAALPTASRVADLADNAIAKSCAGGADTLPCLALA